MPTLPGGGGFYRDFARNDRTRPSWPVQAPLEGEDADGAVASGGRRYVGSALFMN